MKRILIVDDDESIRIILELLIESTFDVDMVLVESADQAIGYLEGESFDLVLCDFHMPIKKGSDVFKFNISQDNTPFVMLTGAVKFDDLDEQTLLNANKNNAIIAKPWDEEKLMGHIEKVLDDSKIEVDQYRRYLAKYLKEDEVFSTDILIKEGENYNVLVEKNSKVSAEVISTIRVKGIQYVYLDEKALYGHLQNKINQLLEALKNEDNPDNVVELVGDSISTVNRALSEFGISETQIELVNNTVSACVKNMAEMKSLKQLLGAFSKDRGYLVAHTLSTVQFSYLLVKEMKIPRHKEVLEKLTFAGVLHDLPLSSSKLSMVLDIPSDRYDNLDAMEREAIQKHPTDAYKLFEQIEDIPQDVGQILKDHHERGDGKGFPRGLTGDRISMLSAMFILTLRFSDALFFNEPNKENFVKIIEGLEGTCSQGNFKKPYEAFKEIINQL
jgi:response regulator RpfG family c-di-GMP phosphodiesterase